MVSYTGYLLHYNSQPDPVILSDEGAAVLSSRVFSVQYEDHVSPFSDGIRTIACHARLDNRGELHDRLELRNTYSSKLSDQNLILLAFHKWGHECVNYLKGDWSFVIWDASTRSLFAAVDFLSTYGLYYHNGSRQFSFSNSLKSLVQIIPDPLALDDAYLLRRFMVIQQKTPNTSIMGVHFIPPGSTLTIKPAGQPTIQRYWTPGHLSRYDVRKESEMLEEFLSIYKQAVERRIPAKGRVASHLSGGLDSGTVSWLAAESLKLEGRPLESYTGTEFFDTSDILNGRGNEERYAKITSAATGHIQQKSFSCPNVSLLDSIREAIESSLNVGHGIGNLFWLQEISSYAKSREIDTLLVGQVGNASVTWAGVSMKRAVRLKSLDYHTWLRSMSRKRKPVDELDIFPGSHFNMRLKKWFQPEWLHQFTLEELLLENDDPIDSYRPDWVHPKRMQLFRFKCSGIGRFWEQFSQTYGFDHLDPTADQDLVEFCLRLPEGYYARNSGRNLVRKAFKGKIPDEVLYNKLKGNQSSDWMLRFQQESGRWEETFRNLPAGHTIHSILNTSEILKSIDQKKKGRPTGMDGMFTGTIARVVATVILSDILQSR